MRSLGMRHGGTRHFETLMLLIFLQKFVHPRVHFLEFLDFKLVFHRMKFIPQAIK